MIKKNYTEENPLKLLVLISGNGSTLQSIIDAIKTEHLPIQVMAVISNRPDAYGLTRAEQAGIDTICVDHTHFENREAFDQTLITHIDGYNPDLIILAGFMRILSTEFVDHYPFGKILNIHPSLLPKHRGRNTHQRALASKDREHGSTVHIVVSELDRGPILAQTAFPITPTDTVSSLEEKIHKIEHTLYIKVIKWFAEGRIEVTQDNPTNRDNTNRYKIQIDGKTL